MWTSMFLQGTYWQDVQETHSGRDSKGLVVGRQGSKVSDVAPDSWELRVLGLLPHYHRQILLLRKFLWHRKEDSYCKNSDNWRNKCSRN